MDPAVPKDAPAAPPPAPASAKEPSSPRARRLTSGTVARIALASAGIQAGAWVVVALSSLGRFFQFSDIVLYAEFADWMRRGLRPYFDFQIEYPPLAMPLFNAPEPFRGIAAYHHVFALQMMLWCAAAAIVTALAVASSSARAAYAVAAAFGLCVVAAGPIVANRFDAPVAFVLALALLFLVRGRPEFAGAALGVGFALKLTPVILLPLALIACRTSRAVTRTATLFAVAAVLPFLPYLYGGAEENLVDMFMYHIKRPLEIESVFATPLLLARVFGGLQMKIATLYGSQVVVAPGADVAGSLTVLGTPAAMLAAYVLVWRRRERVASTVGNLALATLAVLLGFTAFAKVLSPQYFVWMLPAIAVVARDRKPMAAVLLAVLLLTQVLFPGLYEGLVKMQMGPVLVVAARNALLVAAWVLCMRALYLVPRDSVRPAPA